MAHKTRHTMQYTEVAYYDDAGNEVARERLHDDSTYDSSDPIELDEQERGDWL